MIKDVLKEAEDHMRKSIEVLDQDLKGIRTGRASPALVERLQVLYGDRGIVHAGSGDTRAHRPVALIRVSNISWVMRITCAAAW